MIIIQIQRLLKLNILKIFQRMSFLNIQIQRLLKLNADKILLDGIAIGNSNTTIVKVKS